MKKKIIPLLIVLLLTGCSKIDSNTDNYVDIVNNVLNYNNKSVNTTSLGYKYYKPIGVTTIYDGELNKEFKAYNTKFVLYVDIISYYYKNSINFNDSSLSTGYYFAKFNDGYIYINKLDKEYYLKIVYNYAKIESYVKKENLIDIIDYSTIILNSITYNDTLISKNIEDGISFGGEITYEIDKPADSNSKFNEYLQEYVQNNDVPEEKSDMDAIPYEE